ncbi:phosphotransferase [Nocardioides sp.]|uniref:phosphotransferase n=1 Tax=Nocardioides sp. TaxID=35761 RepID=UPI0025CF5ECF|nr:phosphotransferase [Nocardioides sp.]
MVQEYADIALRLPSASERWAGERFRAELRTWVSGAVGEPTSLEPVKQRPWATVWRVETGAGVFYAKQNCSTQSYEAAVVLALNDLAARHVVPLAAVDTTRGLFLTPDLGTPLGEAAADDDVDLWCRVVAAGAQLQLEVARYVERLVRAGLTTLAPGDCVGYVHQQLAAFAALPEDDPRAMPADQQAAVRAALPQVSAWADQVAALRLPLTLCHNDLHGHNVFEVGGELRFFDFADAMVTEPMAALLVPLNVLAHRRGLAPDDPRLARVADAALEVWSEYAPLAELRAALPAALQLARLARTESWIRCTAAMNDAELGEWGDSAAYWLGSLVMAPPIGGTASA